jgi:RNA polymerase sigma-70 factor (ECF subfamily)
VPDLDIQKVIDEYFARIHRAALVLTGNPWDADDLAQETFLVLATNGDRFEGRSSLYTWLYGILLNLERRERRRRGMRRRKMQVLWDQDAADNHTAPAAETTIEVGEWKRGLWARVARLPDGQRQVLVLRFSEHLSYDEIANVMECPLGTVKSRIFHALAGLRQMLAADDGEVCQAPKFPTEDIRYAL